MEKRFKIDNDPELFEMMTEYVHLTNDAEHNIKRAKIIGIKSEKVMVAPGACVRIPFEQIGSNIFIGLYSYLNGNVTIGNNVLIGPHCSVLAENQPVSGSNLWFPATTEQCGPISTLFPIVTLPFR